MVDLPDAYFNLTYGENANFEEMNAMRVRYQRRGCSVEKKRNQNQ